MTCGLDRKCSGYMSPEYAMKGVFSLKSDVYSFGVVMLEIITGKTISGLYDSNRLTLLEYVSLDNCRIMLCNAM